jgi:hypothetical protein
MNLAQRPLRILSDDRAERRVLGAFRFVDAFTNEPVAIAAGVEARFAVIPGIAAPVPVPEQSVQLRQNRRGIFVIFRAPFFDTYIATFDQPQPPEELAGDTLGIRVSVTDAGRFYLPREFQVDVPRSVDPEADDNVFQPVDVRLFRAPNAPLLDGWAVLRVSIARTGATPKERLGGVLIRAFAAPRVADDDPIGVGMTDWRDTVPGEAVVPVKVRRFRGSAGNGRVVETTQDIELEVTRNPLFRGSPGQLPDVLPLESGAHPRLPVPGGTNVTLIRPEAPIRIRAGRETPVALTMP